MTLLLGQSLTLARKRLSEFLPDREAEREARLMMCHALGIGGAQLLTRLNENWPTIEALRLFTEVCEARNRRQPLSQILGATEFYGRAFTVTPDVLTPRSDTETLIDIALGGTFERVLDLGTGSGCILATLLAERPGSTGVGTDLSDAALAVASQNVSALGLQDRAHLQTADWLDGIEGQFDLIVSNPPYIAGDEMPALAPEVRDWEPRLALTPGADGFAAYRVITEAAPRALRPGGRLIVEIGLTQGAGVHRLFNNAGLDQVLLHTDITGHDRVVEGRSPETAQ